MTDLIKRLELKRDVWRGTEFGDDICELLEEAAAALEAAREDAERWRQAFVDERASRYRADGMKIEQARIHAETDAEVAAIDQARGKGGGEGVGNG